MSVEIEVGLENAAKVRMPPAETLPLKPPASSRPQLRSWLMIGGIVVLLGISGLFFYYHNRESTDDAQVDGHITPIASKIYGRVASVLVNDNEAVKAGQTLVKIDPADNQAAV